jgi:hypothetical protein
VQVPPGAALQAQDRRLIRFLRVRLPNLTNATLTLGPQFTPSIIIHCQSPRSSP